MRSFRNLAVLSGAVTLAACGGDTRPQTVGSTAAPIGTPTPTHSFVSPTESKTYEGLGAVQHYQYSTVSNGAGQQDQLYAGDANTARDSGISLTYNPRDAIFELTITRPKGLVTVAPFGFQDPAHRTDFGGALQPQPGVPNFDSARQIQYLEAGSGSGALLSPASAYYTSGYGAAGSTYAVGADGYTSTNQTFFYQKPGTTTKYVTYAGFVRNTISAAEETPTGAVTPRLRETYSLDRAAFVFGERTNNTAVPKTGSGTYTGEMIASVAFNPNLDTDPSAPTYLQWMQGTHSTDINFATLAVASTFSGTMLAPTYDAYTSRAHSLPTGSVFSASAVGTIDLVNTGGFTGRFTTATFTRPGLGSFTLLIAGSSFDGAFFGPNGQEIGGGWRIVGGTPDERIDILGAYTGKKP
ncbi:MAG: hypothetical protein EOP61_17145 [Sphingomonadales bacterium]|nr:MAG: hypothetical protein EOP61_17145 [Sphingomonadales bacterium]